MSADKNRDVLLNLLEEANKVTSDELDIARKMSEESGQPVRDTIVKMGYVDESDILDVLAENLGMESVKLSDFRLEKGILDLIPKETAANYIVLPVNLEEGKLTIAIADPFNVQAMDDLRYILGDEYNLHFVIARQDELESAIDKFYTGDDKKVEEMLEQFIHSEELQTFNRPEIEDEKVDIAGFAASIENTDEFEDDQAPIVKLVNLIIEEAIRLRASDIHFEPFEKSYKVRYRIDGVCHEYEAPPKRLEKAISSRLKIMSGMDLAEKFIPQDGRIRLRVGGRDIDFRVNSLPSLYGESIVLRILDKDNVMLGLEEIGFLPDTVEIFEKLIRKPNGIILITGPTGSGKTTTLYSALSTINNVDTKIITIENPVEYQLEGINQIQVHDEIGLTFAAGLRAMLRQAPNVILVGEIRDLETAEIAIRAALTGHLVFSTLHTNDAPGATTRLIEMGIKPFLVASSIQAVLAQRLARVICKECKEQYYPDAHTLEDFGVDPKQYEGVPLYRGRGCEVCNFTGYKGRSAIFETMIMSDKIKDLVVNSESADRIREVARLEGMRTLKEDGWQKVLRGDTTIVEVLRLAAD